MEQVIQRMIQRLSVPVILGFIHPQWQTGDSFRDDPDAGIDRRKLDGGLGIDCFASATGAELKGRRGADAVLGLIPRTEQGGEGIFHSDLL